MSQQQQQQGGGAGGPGFHTLAMLVLCFGRPYRLMVSKEGTVGRREVGSKNAAYGLLSLAAWLAVWPSQGMALMLALALLAQVWHRLRPGRGHSHAMGVSGFDRLTGRGGWVTAGLFGVAAGLVWRLGPDRSAGTWLAASGAANLAWLALMLQRERAVRQDQTDAILEAQYRRG